MFQAGETSALGGSYSLEGYRSKIANWLDSDKDGLPDDLEINGMITNKGTLVRTDPNNPDTDDDGLSDGYEMGEMCLTKYAFELGTFQYFVRYWYAEYGMRPDEWVFFRMRSDPNEKDSDGDGALDGEDATPGEKNGSINYILYDNTDDITRETKTAYVNFFKKQNITPICLEIFDIYQFRKFFEKLEYGFDENVEPIQAPGLVCFNKIQYSCVDNIILIFHGNIGYLNLSGQTDSVRAYEIESYLVNCSHIKIKNIDCQSCFSGSYTDEIKSIAIELLKATRAEASYGASGLLVYAFNCNQVLFGHYCKYTVDDQNHIIEGGSYTIFEVMFRINGRGIPFYVVDDYPS